MKLSRFAVVSLLGFALLLSVNVFAQVAPSTIVSGSASNGYGPWAYRDSPNALAIYKMFCFENGAMTGPDTCFFRDAPGHISLWNGAGTSQIGSLVNASGAYQGTTVVSITDTAFHALVAASSDILVPGGTIGKAAKRVRIHGDGVYTTGAASLLNVELMVCQVSGCASGTVVAPAGCAVTTTNQANVLANGQFTFDCTLTTTSTVGASGTTMAKSVGCANLGTATSAVLSCFADTSTAASAAFDQTLNEFLNPAFKFTTSNAGNSATLDSYSVEILN